MAKKPAKPTAAQIKAKLANPGERSKLAAKYLTPAQRQQRELNTRLAAPVTPGSSLTNRDLAHQAQNATQLQYGPSEQAINSNIAARVQTEKDTGDWYTAFQNDLRQHAQNIAQINQGQQSQLDATVRAAAGSTAPGGTATADDPAAAAVRAKLAAIGSSLGSTTGANNLTYADTQANVVAPGQKLVGLVNARKDTQSVRDKLSALKGEEGAFNTKFRSDTVAGESKNVLAQQALTGKTAEQQTADALKAAALGETVRSNKAREKITTQTAAQKAAAEAAKVNQYGYTSKDWAALSTGARQKVIKDFKKTSAKAKAAPKPTAGPGSLSSATESKYVSQINKVLQALQNPTITVKDPLTQVSSTKKATPAQVLANLRTQNVDPRILDVARSLYHNKGKGVGQMGVAAAHDLGIHVSGHWRVVR